MKLEYYVLINEIEEMGADECPIHKERPNGTYLKVLTDQRANAGRGLGQVKFKSTTLASQMLRPPRGQRGVSFKSVSIGTLARGYEKYKELKEKGELK